MQRIVGTKGSLSNAIKDTIVCSRSVDYIYIYIVRVKSHLKIMLTAHDAYVHHLTQIYVS